ncbi:uncharacterized protein LOC122518668 [Polistes fuscatus]|uniref:uncharacterized protein LOC122518668 n=1 Tax=Polistes fuscatus TaxID=30207 RepID=UPI001CAA2A78|nr:uncharacterized protein LOC122518668 [Polistes fuscatus]
MPSNSIQNPRTSATYEDSWELLTFIVVLFRTPHRCEHHCTPIWRARRHQQLRQLDYIGQFTTNIIHVAGDENTIADALSRVEKISMPVVVSTQDLAEHQARDEELTALIDPGATTSPVLRKLRVDNTETVIYCDVSGTDVRPYIPQTLRKRIFDTSHNLAHPRACSTKSKIQRHTKNAPERIPIPDTRFHHVHIDIVGPLPLSRGYRYCLTMIDRFTKWPEAIPIADMSADSVTKAFFSGWVARFGAPAIVTTD